MADAPPATLPDVDVAAGELCAALRWVYETCERLGAAESECLPLQLAVEGICTNLMEYGYGERRPHAIGIARLGGDPLGKIAWGIPSRAIWW